MTMKHQTAYLSASLFPPIPWMAALIQYDQCYIEAHETYPKQTFRNRYSILSANGKLDLIVPVKKPSGNHTVVSEILISDHENVSAQHLTALESAYRSAPYFEYFFDDVVHFYNGKYKTLLEMNLASLLCVSRILRKEFSFRLTETYEHHDKLNPEIADFRQKISPKNHLFCSFQAPEYYQVFLQKFPFTANLSILDLIFNLGAETLLYLQKYPISEFYKKT